MKFTGEGGFHGNSIGCSWELSEFPWNPYEPVMKFHKEFMGIPRVPMNNQWNSHEIPLKRYKTHPGQS
jgi:hypothetical protein